MRILVIGIRIKYIKLFLNYIYIYMCVCVSVRTCVSVCIYVWMYTCMYVWMDGWTYEHVSFISGRTSVYMRNYFLLPLIKEQYIYIYDQSVNQVHQLARLTSFLLENMNRITSGVNRESIHYQILLNTYIDFSFNRWVCKREHSWVNIISLEGRKLDIFGCICPWMCCS